MPDPSTYRPAPGSVPDEPGVYRFSDVAGRVLYVGKAKSLRSRLNSYFQDLSALHPRTLAMVTSAAKVEWTVVRTEVEALQLEYSWIKEFDPRFNVRYRDDKSYPYLAVTLDEEFPRAMVMRGAKKRGVRYFGPYAHAWAIRETLDQLLRVFPVRSCSVGVFKRAAQVGRPCLLGYIGKCSAPCVGRVSADEHREIVDDLVAFLDGQTANYVRRLEREMRAAAAATDYERAARLRDDIAALQRAMEQNAVVMGDATDADVVALAEDPPRSRCTSSTCAADGSADSAAGSPTRPTTLRPASWLNASSCSSTARTVNRPSRARSWSQLCPTTGRGRCPRRAARRSARRTGRHPDSPRGDKRALLETVPATRRRRSPCTRRSAPVI